MKELKLTNLLILAAGTLFIVLFVGTNLNAQSSKSLINPKAASPGIIIEDKDEDVDTDVSCGLYLHYGEEIRACASCGDGLCDPYESCTASTITEEFTTSDCGPLYCPQDGEEK